MNYYKKWHPGPYEILVGTLNASNGRPRVVPWPRGSRWGSRKCLEAKSELPLSQNAKVPLKCWFYCVFWKVRLIFIGIYKQNWWGTEATQRQTFQGPFTNTVRTPTAKDCLGNIHTNIYTTIYKNTKVSKNTRRRRRRAGPARSGGARRRPAGPAPAWYIFTIHMYVYFCIYVVQKAK